MKVDGRGRVYVLDDSNLRSGGPGRPWRVEPAPRVDDSCLGLALDAAGSGRVAAMWMIGCPEIGPIVVKVARRFPSGSWSSLRTVGDDGVGDVAVTDTGVVYALVNQPDGGLSVSRQRPGKTWSQPVALDEDPAFAFEIRTAGWRTSAVWSTADAFGAGDVWTARRLRR
jgi:hypothetical protein